MGGDGEGIVAIVQGLDTTGVTLTVMNRPRQQAERRRSPKPRIQLNAINTTSAVNQRCSGVNQRCSGVNQRCSAANQRCSGVNQRSSVEAGTDCMRQANTGVQICDGRYASSYKLAHCRVTPTSPPEGVSEFPPQRREPCRNQGNFEVGGHGSLHCAREARATSTRPRYYGSPMWSERGSVHHSPSPGHDSEAFVHSLRKYPSAAHTASADLIEKLLKYTQAKNSATSRPTKSMRSLHKEKASDTSDMNRVCKHQQTYTRSQNGEGAASSAPLGYRGRTRNFRLYSPMSESRNLRCRGSPCSNYDYLKSGTSRFSRPDRVEVSNRPSRIDRPIRTERPARSVRDVRLTEMSKYLRSTFRKIYDERPVVFQVCPKLKSRYNQHKKNCPAQNKNDSMINDADDQASTSVLSRILASFSGCAMPSTAIGYGPLEPDESDEFCCCNRATQCSCNPDVSTTTSHSEFKVAEQFKSSSCHCCPNTSDKSTGPGDTKEPYCRCSKEEQEYFKKRIDEEISDWLKDVPIYSTESSECKRKRESIIKGLRKSLKELPDDQNFDDNVAHEVNSHIEDFPMWFPGKDKKNEEDFKKQQADRLIEKIIDIPRKPDRFRDIVKKWIQNINFEDGDVDMDVIIDNFVNKLKALAADRPESDRKYKELLKEEIMEMLDELPILIEDDRLTLNKMADKLAEEIVSISKNIDLSKDRNNLTDEFEDSLSDWMDDLSFVNPDIDDIKRDPKEIEALAKKLNKLQSLGMGDEAVIQKMREEIRKFTADIDMALKTLDELIDDLMDQLARTVQEKEIENLEEDELSAEVIEWLRNLPGTADLHARKFAKIAGDLVKNLKEAHAQGADNYEDIILDSLAEAGLSVDPIVLSKHIEELLEILDLWPSDKHWKELAKADMIKEIYNIIDNSPVPEEKKDELKRKVQLIVNKNLEKSKIDFAEEIMREEFLDDMDELMDEVDIPEQSRFDLKSKVSHAFIKNIDKSLKSLATLRDYSDDDIKHIVTKDVRSTVKLLPIEKNKKKDLIHQVKGVLSKTLDKPLPDDIENTLNRNISTIVEKSPIIEDKSIIRYLKDKLVGIASKVLNMFFPKWENVEDIHSKVEKDVGDVIDNSAIDTDTKKDLKKNVQDVLTENGDRRLSDEVKESVKEDITNLVDNLSISEDKKDVLKTTVGDTIARDFDEALAGLKQDINKIKNKISKKVFDAIEKSPISSDGKKHLKNKLKDMLSTNLDTSLSDEQVETIVDDVSNIVKDSIPEEKSEGLKKKLKYSLTKQQDAKKSKKVLTKDIKEAIEEDIINMIDNTSDSNDNEDDLKYSLLNKLDEKLGAAISHVNLKLPEEMHDVIEISPINKDKKREFKAKMKGIIAKHLGEKAAANMNTDDYKSVLIHDISKKINQFPLSAKERDKIKKQIDDMLAETLYQPLTEEVKANIENDIYNIMDSLNIPENELSDVKANKIGTTLTTGLEEMANQGKNVGYIKDAILKDISKVIDNLELSDIKKKRLMQKIKDSLNRNLDLQVTEEIQEIINENLANILQESSMQEKQITDFKDQLAEVVRAQNLEASPTQEYIDEETEDEDTSPIPKIVPIDEHQTKEIEQNNLRELETRTKDIMQGIEKSIDETPIPKEKKEELKQKLKTITSETFNKPLSKGTLDALKDGFNSILEELPLEKEKKYQFKQDITKTVEDKMGEDLKQHEVNHKTHPRVVVLENQTQVNIRDEVGKSIDEAPIPAEKKRKLKEKLNEMISAAFTKPLTNDTQDDLNEGIYSILEEIPLSDEKKNKLKQDLKNKVEKNINALQDEVKKVRETGKISDMGTKVKEKSVSKALLPITDIDKFKAKESITQGIEKKIKESPIPEEKKLELKQKLQTMVDGNLKKPLSEDVQMAIHDGITDILDELPVAKAEKDKLKQELTSTVDDTVEYLRDDEKQKMEAQTQNNILKGLEKSIDDAPIPIEKKRELKRKLDATVSDSFKTPFSSETQDALRKGITKILEEVPLSTEKKNKLQHEFSATVDENIKTLRDDIKKRDSKQNDAQPLKELESHTQDMQNNIIKGFEKSINRAPIPAERKREIKRKLLKALLSKSSKTPLPANTQVALKEDINKILEEVPLSKEKKIKLENELATTVDQNIDAFHDQIKEDGKTSEAARKTDTSAIQHEEKVKTLSPTAEIDKFNAKAGDIQGIEEKIKESPITEEKAQHLSELESRAQQNMMQELEKSIEDAPIPKEKKNELKQKLKAKETDILSKPLSENTQDALKDDIKNVLAEIPLPKDKKDKLEQDLMGKVEENIISFQDQKNEDMKAKTDATPKDHENIVSKSLLPITEIDKSKVKEGVIQGIEQKIAESQIPEEKKLELKQKLQSMVDDNLKKPLSEDVQMAIHDGITDILDELPVAKAEKDKLKQELTSTVDDTVKYLRDDEKQKMEAQTQNNILKGLEKSIDEAPIPIEKKRELKRKLDATVSDSFKTPFSSETQDALREGINKILEEVSLPTEKKNKLQHEFSATVDENIKTLRDDIKKLDSKQNDAQPLKELESHTQDMQNNIIKGFEKSINRAPIPAERKREIKRKLLKALLSKSSKTPLPANTQIALKEDINKILEEVPLSKEKKIKLENELATTVDQNIDAFHDQIKEDGKTSEAARKTDTSAIQHEEKVKTLSPTAEIDKFNAKAGDIQGIEEKIKESPITEEKAQHLSELESRAQQNMMQELEKSIEDAPIPKEKKNELKQKLKAKETDILSKPLSENTQDALKDDIKNVLAEIPLPKDKKDKLEQDLMGKVEENIISFQDQKNEDMKAKTDAKPKDHENIVSKNLLPITEIDKSKVKEGVIQGIEQKIAESQIPEEKKLELKQKLQSMVDDNLKKPLSEDVQMAINDGISDILDELPVAKAEKDKLKQQLTSTVDDTVEYLRDNEKQKMEVQTQNNILQGLETSIDEAPIPAEKKKELKKKINAFQADTFKKPFSDSTQNELKEGINKILDEVPMPQEKKNKLQRELVTTVDQNMSTFHYQVKNDSKPAEVRRHSVEIAKVPEKGVSKILPSITETDKSKMQDGVTKRVEKKIEVSSQEKAQDLRQLETSTKRNIMQELEKSIEEAPLPREKKNELKQKMKALSSEILKKPLSGDTQIALKDGINQILDEIPLPKEKKSKLKGELTGRIEDNMGTFEDLKKEYERERDDSVKGHERRVSKTLPPQISEEKAQRLAELQARTQCDIVQDLEKSIEKAPLPREKKNELKQKLKAKTSDILMKPLSADTEAALKDTIKDILEEIPLPKENKAQLENKLAGKVENNLKAFQDQVQKDQRTSEAKRVSDTSAKIKEKGVDKTLLPFADIDKSKAKESITQGIEKKIEESPIPEEKKLELKQKLHSMVDNNLKKPLSEDVQMAINDGISDILDELPVAKAEKDKLKQELTSTVDDTVEYLRDVEKQKMEVQTQNNILQGLETSIDEAPIPAEKKKELKKKINAFQADTFKKPLSDSTQNELKEGINKILDEVPMPQEKKNKLQRELVTTVDQNMSTFHYQVKNDSKPAEVRRHSVEIAKVPEKGVSKTLRSITETDKSKMQDGVTKRVEKKIEVSSQEKAQDLRQLETSTKRNIMQELEKSIEEAPLPREKKNELKQKLKAKTSDILMKPLSADTEAALKDTIKDILEEIPLPKENKAQLENELAGKVENNLKAFQDQVQKDQRTSEAKRVSDTSAKIKQKGVDKTLLPFADIDKSKAKESITQGIEKKIEESPIPEEKKLELKQKLQSMVNNNLKKPLSEDVQMAINDGISDILDELPVAKAEKDKLKQELTSTVDDTVEYLRDVEKQKMEVQTQNNILQGLETSIDEAPIPAEKKKELKKKINAFQADTFKKPLSDSTQNELKEGINKILDEVPMPQEKKNKLQRELVTTVDQVMSTFHYQVKNDSKPAEVRRHSVEIAKVPEKGVSKTLRSITETDKSKMQDGVTKRVEKKIEVSSQEKAQDLRQLETSTKRNIMQELEKSIEEAPLPREKKNELKQKLKAKTSDILMKPLSADTEAALKDTIKDILEEIPLPKENKAQLENELAGKVENNLKAFQDQVQKDQRTSEAKRVSDTSAKIKQKGVDKTLLPFADIDKSKAKESITQGIEKKIEESPIPEEKKLELKQKLQSMVDNNLNKPQSVDLQKAINYGITDILEDLPVAKAEKDKLKQQLTSTVDDTVVYLRDDERQKMEAQTQNNISQGLEKSIDEAPIPAEKKKELKKKLNAFQADTFKKPLSDSTQNELKEGINKILDEVPMPQEKKNKLQRELVTTVDQNMSTFHYQAKNDSKPAEVRRHSVEIAKVPEKGVSKTLPSIIETDKSKMQDGVTKRVEKKIEVSSQEKAQDLRQLETSTKRNIMQELEKSIEEAPLPREKKNELKQKMKALSSEILKKPLSGDTQIALKDGINQILDEIPLPKEKKSKLKGELTGRIEDNMGTFEDLKKEYERERDDSVKGHERRVSKTLPPQISEEKAQRLAELQARTQCDIVQDLEKSIEKAPLPREKKNELKQKLKAKTSDILMKPLSADTEAALKDTIKDILEEIPLPKENKAQLENKLAGKVENNLKAFQDQVQKDQRTSEAKRVSDTSAKIKEKGVDKTLLPFADIDKSKAKESITQGIEKKIEESPIPEEKKLELKQKLHSMVDNNLKKPLSEDVQMAINDGISDILDELPVAKAEKDKLKQELTSTVDDTVEYLRDDEKQKMEAQTQNNILKGLEKSIDEAPIPIEKKRELKRKLDATVSDSFKTPFSSVTQDALREGINKILEEVPLPIEKKNKLQHEFSATVDENTKTLKDEIKKRDSWKEVQTRPQSKMIQELEKSIQVAPIPAEKKNELKQKLQTMATEKLKEPLSEDTQADLKYGINEIFEEISLPQDKKNKLQRELTDKVEKNMRAIQDQTKDRKSDPSVKGYEKRINQTLPSIKEIDKSKETEGVVRGVEKKVESPVFGEKYSNGKTTRTSVVGPKTSIEAAEAKVAIVKDVKRTVRKSLIPEKKKDKLEHDLATMLGENIQFWQDKKKQQEAEDAKKSPDPQYIQELEDGIISDLKDLLRNGGDIEDMVRTLKAKIMRETNLSEEEAEALARQLIDKALAKEKPDGALKKPGKSSLEDILDQYNLDPNYIKELGDIAGDIEYFLRNGGDPEDMIRKLKEKIMRDTGLSEEEAEALARQLVDRALAKERPDYDGALEKQKKTSLVDILNKYNLDPNYIKELGDIAGDIESFLRSGGDPEDMIRKLKEKIMRDTGLSEEEAEALARQLVDRALAKERPDYDGAIEKLKKTSLVDILNQYNLDPNYIKELGDIAGDIESFLRSGGDPEDMIRKLKEKIMRDTGLSEEEAEALARQLVNRALAKERPDYDGALEKLKKTSLVDILNQYNLDPNYIKELGDIAGDIEYFLRNGGDPEDMIRKLKKKIMRDTGLSEEEAEALARQLVDRALAKERPDYDGALEKLKKTSLVDILNQYNLDPNYIKELGDIAGDIEYFLRNGGDPEDMIRKLKEKIMRDTGLSEEEAEALARQLVDRALAKERPDYDGALEKLKKTSLVDILNQYNLDPNYIKELGDIAGEIEYFLHSGGDPEDMVKKLKEKIMRETNLSEEEAEALARQLVDRALAKERPDYDSKHKKIGKSSLEDILNQYNLDPNYIKELSDIVGDIEYLLRNGGDPEDMIRKLKEKIMRDTNLSEEEAEALARQLLERARNNEMQRKKDKLLSNKKSVSIIDVSGQSDVKRRFKELMTQAMKIAVDQSRVDGPNKNALKSELTKILILNVDKSPFITQKDVEDVKDKMLDDSKNIVDDTVILEDEKNELKSLLAEALAREFYIDKNHVPKKEVILLPEPTAKEFTDDLIGTINIWMDIVHVELEPDVQTGVTRDLAKDIVDRQKYLKVNTGVKPSDKEELDNLKYQVFRRMNKVVDPEYMRTILDGTEQLLRMIRDIEVPDSITLLREPQFKGSVDHIKVWVMLRTNKWQTGKILNLKPTTGTTDGVFWKMYLK